MNSQEKLKYYLQNYKPNENITEWVVLAASTIGMIALMDNPDPDGPQIPEEIKHAALILTATMPTTLVPVAQENIANALKAADEMARESEAMIDELNNLLGDSVSDEE